MSPTWRVVRLFRLQKMLRSAVSVTLITRWAPQLISAGGTYRERRSPNTPTPRQAPPAGLGAARLPGERRLRVVAGCPDPGLRPVQGQPDRDRAARHQLRRASRIAHRVRRTR